MPRYRPIILALLTTVFIAGLAYCGDGIKDQQLKSITGPVTQVDGVGDVIEINTSEGLMAFSVPDDAEVIVDTEKAELMDIETGDTVTIEYYSLSLGKFIAVSIQDNKASDE